MEGITVDKLMATGESAARSGRVPTIPAQGSGG
jgi:hypothetical protein